VVLLAQPSCVHRQRGWFGNLLVSRRRHTRMDDSLTPTDLTPTDPTPARFDRRNLLRFAGLGALGAVTAAAMPRLSAAALTPAKATTTTSPAWGVGANNPGTTPFWNGTTTVPVPPPPTFAEVIARVTSMTEDYDLQQRASRYGLNIVNVMWEDTGRYEGSSVGPNISDLTLQVREPISRDQGRTHLLPVLRYPNFSDTTADVRLDKIWVKVGNQHKSSTVVSIPLSELLGNLRAYLADPFGLPGNGNFLAARDTHVLTSAQHVFMPLPKTGKAEFTPVIYNYQSSPGNPAVLSILITRQGASATIVENYSGDQSYQSWGQQLYFNNKGQRTVFTAERRSAVKERVERGRATEQDSGALDSGSDMVMIIQVPLVHQERYNLPASAAEAAPAPAPAPPAQSGAAKKAVPGGGADSAAPPATSDVEAAVIGFGTDQGPFKEIGGRALVRDDRFPIRVTVQFYKATSNGVVNDVDLQAMKAEIDKVYSNADFVGSLVVPTNDRPRPTAWVKGRTPRR
jgi:hypothetical protein